MITAEYVRTMAAYNRWQNRSVYAAADTLSDSERRADRSAFFGSIHGTLNHLLWGDQIWMSRFAGTPAPKAASIPESPGQIEEWEALKRQRVAFDEIIVGWAREIDPDWLGRTMTWFSVAVKREVSAPHKLLVAHLFNHQTHHRGQVHAMLTAAGASPDDTDLMLLAIRDIPD
ncbi:MAG: DinB family protein [Rhodospirillaceae bacterium]